MKKKIRLTMPGMLRWLETKEFQEVVGTSRSDGSCPIAEYIKSQGALGVSVGWDIVFVNPEDVEERHCMTARQRKFIRQVDKVGYRIPIRAHEAIRFIRKAGVK